MTAKIAKKAKLILDRPNRGVPHVDYWKIKKGRAAEHVNHVCFGSMGGDKGVPDAIRYIAPISPLLKEGQMDFYLGFMKRVLSGGGGPKFGFRKVKHEVGELQYRIETKGMTYIQCLFYLTWFRYVYEFPEIITHWHEKITAGDDDETIFRKFQETHYDKNAGNFRTTYDDMAGHGLIYTYSGYGGESYSSKSPITIAKLHENIKAKPPTVHAHFR